MPVTFDGPNKIITATSGTTSLDVGADIYSRWKDWTLIGDNSKWPVAFETVGGDPTVGGNNISVYYFLQNGWKIRPQEANHSLAITGIILTSDQSSPFISTIGTYNVSIQSTVPLQAETVLVETGVSGLTAEESATLEYTKLVGFTNGRVFVDINDGTVGTSYPVGTSSEPSNNLSDALIIANVNGLDHIHLEGAVSIPTSLDVQGIHFIGSPTGNQVTFINNNLNGCIFEGMTIIGPIGSGRLAAIDADICDVTGWDGKAKDSAISGDVTIRSTATEIQTFDNCVSHIAGTARPTLNINGANAPISIRNYSGGLTISNLTAGNSVSIDIVSGTVEIDASCTSGTIVIRGVGHLINNGSATTNTDGFVEASTAPTVSDVNNVSESVWSDLTTRATP